MKNLPFLLIITLLFSCSTPEKNKIQNANYINPLICTADDRGQTDPSASIPFGMVKPCPDTYPKSHAGYYYNSEEILGFSHTRFSGVGCRGTGGNIRILPYVIAEADSIPAKIKYLKDTEIATPGYYSVKLEDNIKCELTGTRQVAFHKYTFPESNVSGISIDLTSSFAKHKSQEYEVDNKGTISGKVSSDCVCNKGTYSFYFAISIDKEGMENLSNDSVLNYKFSTTNNEGINIYCALSVVSAKNAKENLKEAVNLKFEEVKNSAFNQWNDLMNVVNVETTDSVLKTLFYTHLYHACQSPFNISDPNGEYRGSDGEKYTTKEGSYYHGWSIWDTFRSKLPLLSFLYPDIYSDMMTSLGNLYKQGKPDWGTETEPFLTVRTEHSIIILLDAYRKGLLSFSLNDIYEHLKKEAENLPYKSPDNILESSFDFWALSEIAKELGYNEDYETYKKRAFEYENIWKEKFMIMNDSTSDIMHGDGLYEGTLWQYRWFVPFDIEGIQKLVGGKNVFEEQLDYFFDNELFNIGNQPDIQVPYLYAYTDSPWKMQALVNKLLTKPINNWYGTHKKWEKPDYRNIFTATPDGYIKEMDDDAGTMSSWYVCSALGLYPVFPGDTKLVINTPLFDKSTIKIGENELIIKAKGLSSKAIYIQNIKFNGKDLNSYFIDFNTIKEGGKLEIQLGETPNKQFGVKI